MSVLAAIGVLALLIVVHELGHFAAARLQGIHVNRFSIGFGPILWKYQGSQTEYAIRGFPLGGFVGFPDDDPDSNIPADDPDLLRNRPLLDRAIVISAGVIANLVFAYLLLVVQFGTVGAFNGFDYQPGVLVPRLTSDSSPAAIGGIRPGDVILSVDGQKLAASKEATTLLTQTIQSKPNQKITFTVQRGDRELALTVTPEQGDKGKGQIGVQLQPLGKALYKRPDNFFGAFTLGAEEFQKIVSLTLQGFGQLVSNFQRTASQVAGPVAIVALGADIAHKDATALFHFAALISINLAIINILPLPALDGGQLTFLLIEGLRGQPLPTRIQDGVMQTGLMLLLGLGIFLIIRDTANLWIR
ncbi:RIP metalloprotease RseP [Leptolyngbya sp. 'hensonii']|uniref:RIP metalloprotease RseP n=1 Tax=Leptolyngbya sp. 'hensonii' TaxID=1922337 RepID=UPI00094FDEDB|nr:RIP metalloprotease RseP [Leptolyngbya sp. 'hensonii']OLP18507.1 RIP metalloprotease RseP [Leptolyngbya sp. 'hensonii']